ncbi:hypothetical protein MAHJHV29_49380 [Mycobacterium avium subsp. hominissuis]
MYFGLSAGEEVCVCPTSIVVENDPQWPEFLLRDYGIRVLTAVIFNYSTRHTTIYEGGD